MLGSSAVDLRPGGLNLAGPASSAGWAQPNGGGACHGGGRSFSRHHVMEKKMLWTIAVVLIVLWLLGLVSSYTLGGAIHVLLVIAIAVFLIGIFQGRRTG